MVKIISSEIVVAYSQCLLKAFRLLHNKDSHLPHEYVQIIANHAQVNKDKLLNQIKTENKWMKLYDTNTLAKGNDLVIDGKLVLELRIGFF